MRRDSFNRTVHGDCRDVNLADLLLSVLRGRVSKEELVADEGGARRKVSLGEGRLFLLLLGVPAELLDSPLLEDGQHPAVNELGLDVAISHVVSEQHVDNGVLVSNT